MVETRPESPADDVSHEMHAIRLALDGMSIVDDQGISILVVVGIHMHQSIWWVQMAKAHDPACSFVVRFNAGTPPEHAVDAVERAVHASLP